jgi:hypothetical protein
MQINYKILTKNSNNLEEFIDLCIVGQDILLPIPNIGELVLLDNTLYKVVHKVITLDKDKEPSKINIVLEVI